MVDKMIIIYDYDGYKDPKIKNVEVSKVNGYKTIITKEGKEVRNEMTDQKKDEKRFSQEEAKVNIYMKENPKVSYREAVLACLDSSEGLPETTQEFAQLSSEEIAKMKQMVSDTIYNLSKMKGSKAFNVEDQGKLNQAYNLVVEIQKNLQILIDKNT